VYTHRRALVEIHVCVLLWGFTAILGKLITLPALQLVWWRMLLVSAALACVPRVWRALACIPARRVLASSGVGVLVALHWLAFYGAVKLANASVAATTMALAPVATALIEPAITGARFERHNLLLGIAVIPGVALVVGGIPGAMQAGFWLGVVSAALAALFNVLNKRLLGSRDALAVTALELGAGFLFVTLLLVLPVMSPAGQAVVWPTRHDGAWLLALAFFCTLVPYAVSLGTLRRLSSFTVQLAINLEPVYAIAIAVLFLGEARELGARFFVGVAIVLAAVFGHAWLEIRAFGRTRSLTDERPSV
jgi:drug/metabolite transporter (DMT)-like permease